MLDALPSINMIDGVFLVLVAVTVVYGAARVYLFIAEMGIVETDAVLNNHVEAQAVFLDLVKQTERSLVVHDDGNDAAESVYNAKQILDAIAEGIASRNIRVECLFNVREPLGIVSLAESYPANILLSYRHPEGRPAGENTHYKIVDDGKLLHLSVHGYGANDREYKLGDATRAWKAGRKRYSRPWRERFEQDVADLTT